MVVEDATGLGRASANHSRPPQGSQDPLRRPIAWPWRRWVRRRAPSSETSTSSASCSSRWRFAIFVSTARVLVLRFFTTATAMASRSMRSSKHRTVAGPRSRSSSAPTVSTKLPRTSTDSPRASTPILAAHQLLLGVIVGSGYGIPARGRSAGHPDRRAWSLSGGGARRLRSLRPQRQVHDTRRRRALSRLAPTRRGELMRFRLASGAVGAVLAVSLLTAGSAAAATEFGDTCSANSPVTTPYTLTTLTAPPASLPLTAPTSGGDHQGEDADRSCLAIGNPPAGEAAEVGGRQQLHGYQPDQPRCLHRSDRGRRADARRSRRTTRSGWPPLQLRGDLIFRLRVLLRARNPGASLEL